MKSVQQTTTEKGNVLLELQDFNGSIRTFGMNEIAPVPFIRLTNQMNSDPFANIPDQLNTDPLIVLSNLASAIGVRDENIDI